ncbi:MAG: class B sortase [Ruminococcaceae bacterium]|nr:class B sortase [Oscillospiraceae bacterium]
MKKTLIILLIIFIIIFIASLILIGLNIKSRNNDIIAFEKLSHLVKAPLPKVTLENGYEPSADTNQPNNTASSASNTDNTQQTDKLNLQPLFDMNKDCAGWITVPGTKIDYPVMHTPDEPNKYFRRNFSGKYSVSGVPYIFETCTESSTNLIIFGHNMLNGTMFAGLLNYQNKSFFDLNRCIEYQTANGSVIYEIFCVAVIDDTDSWYAFTQARDEREFDKRISDIKSRSIHFSNNPPAFGDRLITLSTCYNRTGPKRLIVIAKSGE